MYGQQYSETSYSVTPIYGGTTYTKELTDTISFTDSVLKTATKLLAETLTLTDNVIKTFSRIFEETITFTDSIVKTAEKLLTEVFTFTDSVLKTVGRNLTETLTLTDTFERQIQKVLTETLNFLDISLGFVLNRISSGIKKTIISLFKGEFFGDSGEVNKPTGIIRSSEKPEGV